MRSFFDTNVLVYLFDKSAPEKSVRAGQLFERESKAGQAVLSTQVLQEFYVTVTRKFAQAVPLIDAEQAVRSFSVLPLAQVDGGMVLAAIARSQRAQLSFWDSLIIEAAISSGAERIYTEDLQHGQQFDGVRIENPFR